MQQSIFLFFPCLLRRPFSIDEDLLTPTFKLKRPQLLRKYKEQVRDLVMVVSLRKC